MRSIWAGHVEKLRDDNLAECRCQGSGGEMEVRKTESAMGDCIKSDLERVGEGWKNYR